MSYLSFVPDLPKDERVLSLLGVLESNFVHNSMYRKRTSYFVEIVGNYSLNDELIAISKTLEAEAKRIREYAEKLQLNDPT